jgi:hypothetical protein
MFPGSGFKGFKVQRFRVHRFKVSARLWFNLRTFERRTQNLE